MYTIHTANKVLSAARAVLCNPSASTCAMNLAIIELNKLEWTMADELESIVPELQKVSRELKARYDEYWEKWLND